MKKPLFDSLLVLIAGAILARKTSVQSLHTAMLDYVAVFQALQVVTLHNVHRVDHAVD